MAPRSYFSAFNLPNVVSVISNRTLPKYRLDVEHKADEIRDKNGPDVALYEWVEENPRIPAIEQSGGEPSPLTILVFESESQSRSKTEGRLFHTETVFAVLAEEPELINDIGRLSKLCAEFGN